ncbi:Serine protease HTRA1A [Echinococcus granulosus]|nr:Serine protease HTRA1A [Echinococcus granulosus]
MCMLFNCYLSNTAAFLINKQMCSFWVKILRTSWVSPPRWRGIAATSQFHHDDAFRYHCSYRHSQHKRSKWNFLPCLALSVPLIAFTRQNDASEDDHDDASNKSSLGLFSTVICATDLSPERLAAIRSLNILSKVVEEVSPAVVSITAVGHLFQVHASTGSGFIVDNTGLVITNAHVVGYKQALKVSTPSGQEFGARVLALDVNSDLALIQILADTETLAKLPVLKLASGEQAIRPGDFVIALGSPLSLSNTVTAGVVSAVDRDLGNRTGLKYIQTDAIITFGNSGGPLVSLYGEVIGVNTMIADTGLSFAIPIDQVHRFLATAKEALAAEEEQRRQGRSRSASERSLSPSPQPRRSKSWQWFGSGNDETAMGRDAASVIVESGKRQTRYLGLVMRTLTPELVAELISLGHLRAGSGVDRAHCTGVYIQGVIRNSPAERADLRPGDVIIAINGTKIINANEVAEIIKEQESFSVTVLRNGEQLEIDDVKSEPV